MPEDVQQELVEIYGERRVKEDSLIKKFATGMLAGGISAPLGALGVPVMVAPSIINTVGRRFRNVKVLNVSSKLLTKSKRNKNNPSDVIHEPGMTTYVIGLGIAALGAILSETPIGPILIGIGAGMVGTGISTVGENGAEQARNRNRRE
ncbi:hypothetical protein [Candidatus Rhabdochlamydia sp. T3358]|uniref:hypothetical protein n=1 Tax=Candidatus Rhabdochlamydia sp. T3358 TaxID=2099795 RepID=UPI0010B31C41|nr:hypothetical protein [Candidatus Rhabdochlamydia sp. T3358]VHN99520.1 hypothetical protein RHT_00031 [Candidatus Rhabdochlamydia sp. T3358]